MQTCCCCAALLPVLIASSLTRQLHFSWLKAWCGESPGQFYSSLGWGWRLCSGCVVMALFAPEWQVHQHLLVNVSNGRQWCLCSPHSPLGLLTGRWLILSFLMSVNSAMADKEWFPLCWRAQLSFSGLHWHIPKLEPEVDFHSSQSGMWGFFLTIT